MMSQESKLLNLKLLTTFLVLLAVAMLYLVYGFTSKCGGFEGKACPRGFKCNLTETPGYVVYGHLDKCGINTPW